MLTKSKLIAAANRSETMTKQIVTVVLGAAIMLGTATSLFAQTSGVAVGGGAAGGPNGIYKDPYGFNGNNTYSTVVHRKQR